VRETVLIPHIEVDADRHDLGIGSLLMRRILDDARAEGHTVLALCPFAHRWVDLHPNYRDVARRPKAGETAAVNALIAADRTMRLLHRAERSAGAAG
jgi:GNAT superfamily N-acetyltransferase